MRMWMWFVLVVLGLGGAVAPAAGETVLEAWRGGIDYPPAAITVNAADSSCWASDLPASGDPVAQVIHLSESGARLVQVGGFLRPYSVSVNPIDSSCWVTDASADPVVHLAVTGEELWRGADPTTSSVAVNPNDGSCWVGHQGGPLLHLAADGTELWRGKTSYNATCISVNTADNSIWVATWEGPLHVAADGTLLWQGTIQADFVSVNSTDGSCWIGRYDGPSHLSRLMHISASGQELWRREDFDLGGCRVSAMPKDGSCWVAYSAGRVVHFSAEGAVLWQSDAYSEPRAIAVNPVDGSCWIGEAVNTQVIHLVVLGEVFPDINSYQWAQHEIEACFHAGVVGGYPDGNYHPSDPVSRDQMAVFISRALAGGDASVPTGPETASFPDVPVSQWAFKYVEYAKSHGIVTGYGDGTYQPTVPVDRGQMAVFISRSMVPEAERPNLPNYTPPTTPSFPDVPSSFWSYKYIEYIKGGNVAGGYPDGLYHPEYGVTRDQMAVYVARAFGLPL